MEETATTHTDLDQAQTIPKHLFSQRDPLLSGEEKLKWPLSDSGRKTAANGLPGVIYKKRTRGRALLEGQDVVVHFDWAY